MAKRKWSHKVTQRSNALDLDRGVFTRTDPRSIARWLKRSADRSRRRKADPFRSAMSMLTFYINRAGKTTTEALVVSRDVSMRKGTIRLIRGHPKHPFQPVSVDPTQQNPPVVGSTTKGLK